jgi:hypothetical protein
MTLSPLLAYPASPSSDASRRHAAASRAILYVLRRQPDYLELSTLAHCLNNIGDDVPEAADRRVWTAVFSRLELALRRAPRRARPTAVELLLLLLDRLSKGALQLFIAVGGLRFLATLESCLMHSAYIDKRWSSEDLLLPLFQQYAYCLAEVWWCKPDAPEPESLAAWMPVGGLFSDVFAPPPSGACLTEGSTPGACPVCSEPFAQSFAARLTCNHTVHLACALTWFRAGPLCLLCCGKHRCVKTQC